MSKDREGAGLGIDRQRQDCLDLVSHQTMATNGAIAVRLRCRVSIPCDGALVVAQADFRNGGPDPLKLAPGQWVAASNFRVPANATANVLVKLTTRCC